MMLILNSVIGTRKYIPCLCECLMKRYEEAPWLMVLSIDVYNKIDAISIEELDLLYRIPNAVPISSEHGWNIDELMDAM